MERIDLGSATFNLQLWFVQTGLLTNFESLERNPFQLTTEVKSQIKKQLNDWNNWMIIKRVGNCWKLCINLKCWSITHYIDALFRIWKIIYIYIESYLCYFLFFFLVCPLTKVINNRSLVQGSVLSFSLIWIWIQSAPGISFLFFFTLFIEKLIWYLRSEYHSCYPFSRLFKARKNVSSVATLS